MDRRSRLPLARPDGASPSRWTRLAQLAIAASSVVAAAGCGTPSSDAQPAAPSTNAAVIATEPPASAAPSTATSTAPPGPDEVAVRAVMDRFWPAYLDSLAAPEPENAVLAELLSGEAATTVLGRFREMARTHQRTVAPEPSAYAHHILSVAFPEPGAATVRECLVDDLRLIQDVERSTALPDGGLIVLDDDVVTAEVTSTLRQDEVGWHITNRETTEVLELVRDCDLFSP